MATVKRKRKIKSSLIISSFTFIALVLMTIGFASFGQVLNLNGEVSVKSPGTVYIKSVTRTAQSSSPAPVVTSNPTWDGFNIDFHLQFATTKNNTSQGHATFKVVIQNDSFLDYVYTTINYDYYVVQNSDKTKIDSSFLNYEITGLSQGDIIYANQEKEFYVTFTFSNPKQNADTYIVNGEFIPATSIDTEAHVYASIADPAYGDLRGNLDTASFTLNILSSYPYDQYFTISLGSDKYTVTDVNGDPLGTLTIPANSDNNSYNFYVHENVDNEYYTDSERVVVYVNIVNKDPLSANRITLLVDKNIVIEDTSPPEISNVVATIQDAEGEVYLTWDGEDISNVQKYIIYVYNADTNEVVKTVETEDDTDHITITGLSAGTSSRNYYFVVVGVDDSVNHNTATSEDIVQAQIDTAGAAARSETSSYQWLFNISYSCDSYTTCPSNGTVSRRANVNVSVSLNSSADSNRQLNGVTVTMGGETFPQSNYSYTIANGSRSATFKIENIVITGDLSVSFSSYSICLVEGTKIMLANGTYKNIEDIDYSDLILVYDHQKGKLSSVYPIWIEKSHVGTSYIEVTFEDNTTLKTAIGGHSVFSVEKSKYINVASEEFKVGSHVYKLKNGKLVKVKVKNIEVKFKAVNLYNFITVGYYNAFANDVLSQESFANATNAYTFVGKDLKYGLPYYLIKIGPKLPYEYFKNTVPYHIYKGSNLANAYTMVGNNFDEKFLRHFAFDEIKEPYKINGNNAWFVTTSLDDLSKDKTNYMYEQGSIYTLPKNKKVKCFFNTYDDICYSPGEKIVINHSLHFIAIYK